MASHSYVSHYQGRILWLGAMAVSWGRPRSGHWHWIPWPLAANVPHIPRPWADAEALKAPKIWRVWGQKKDLGSFPGNVVHDTYLYTCLDATSPSAARKRFLLSPGSLSLVLQLEVKWMVVKGQHMDEISKEGCSLSNPSQSRSSPTPTIRASPRCMPAHG